MTVVAHIGHHPALAWRLIEGGDIDRTLSRRPALEDRLIDEMGVDADGRPFVQPDQERIDFVLRKLAAGLYFLKFGEAPGIAAFKSLGLYQIDNPPDFIANLSWQFKHVEPMRVTQWSVFYSGFCNAADDAKYSYCNINFYNSVFAIIACPHQRIE